LQISINSITYTDLLTSNSKLIQFAIPPEGQTFEYLSQDQINARTFTLSTRNSAGAYNVPLEKDKVYLNYIPKKVFVSDSDVKEYIGNDFTFFVVEPLPEPELFTLPEGQIFRCFSSDSLPLPKENYQYWIIENGKKKKIPNYQTLEVMLAERNQTLLSVRVIPESECEQIPEELQGSIPDKSGSWTEEYSDKTNKELLKELEKSAKDGAAIAEGAKSSADAQIAAVKAAEEKAKAQADQAKMEAAVAKAASEAAIAEAQAAQAQAELAILQVQQNNS